MRDTAPLRAEMRALSDLDGTIRAAILAGRPVDRTLAGRVRMLDFTDRADLVDLGFVTTLPGLTRLILSGTGVRDLTPLAGVPTLEALTLLRTEVEDLAPLARLPRLAELVIYRTRVTDLTPLAGSLTLRRLDIGTSVGDLAVLGGLPNLAVLDIGDGSGLRRLDLSGFPALETLVGVTVGDASLWPVEFPATLRELIVGGSAWPEGRALPELPRLITPDWRLIDDGEPCSDPFEFWRMVCLAEDDSAAASGSEGERGPSGRLGD